MYIVDMIYIPKNLPKKYSAVFIYVVAEAIYNNVVTTKQLIMKMKLNDTQHTRKFINTCIGYMLDNEIVDGKKLSMNKYEIYRKEVNLKSGKYYSVEYSDISKIIDIPDQCNRLDLIDYYLVLSSTINYYSKIGFISIATLSERCGITEATICKYNKILVKNKIIYIRPSRKQGVSNRYCHYKDIDKLKNV